MRSLLLGPDSARIIAHLDDTRLAHYTIEKLKLPSGQLRNFRVYSSFSSFDNSSNLVTSFLPPFQLFLSANSTSISVIFKIARRFLNLGKILVYEHTRSILPSINLIHRSKIG